jgi:thiol-disulfide isomerase/thioredoxin
MVLGERLEIVRKDSLLSDELKSILAKDFGLFMYSGHVFDYESEMKLNYRNINNDENGEPNIQKIDRTYYRFLKDMKLNDLEYLQCFSLVEFQMKILQNETIALPLIEESDIASWIANTKHILGDLLGFKDGPYYDILAANAYARQLNEEVRPLSKKQKEHIARYWKNGEIAKILLRKNQQVEESDKFKTPAIVHDISSVPAEQVMETIVAKHQNKVVLVDLWATWCAPCLDAMQQFRTAKGSFKDKDVAFVYLSNRSSPQKLWEEKIKGIGGEQYYLSDAQWEYVMDHYGFEAIPSYVIYDRAGSLVHKFTGFPGSDKMTGMIDEASKSQELN